MSVALACEAHAPYYICHLWFVWICRIFPNYLTNDTIFGQNLLNVKGVLIFSAKYV